jgi:hypothetical protein
MAREILATGASKRDAAKQIAQTLDVARNRAYEIAQSASAEGSAE